MNEKLLKQIKKVQALYNTCTDKDKKMIIGWRLSGGKID